MKVSRRISIVAALLAVTVLAALAALVGNPVERVSSTTTRRKQVVGERSSEYRPRRRERP